ncbi:MAG: SdpI family protein [Erysipelotrichaceae bacterium]|nr:SdpI family protein [Erysipelotrichaceae bacterium]
MKRFGNQKWKVVISFLLCLCPLFAGLILWNRLPDPMPIHFNLQGEIDNYGSKLLVVVGMGLFMAALHLLCLYVTTKDPENGNVSDTVMDLTVWAVPAISLFVSFMIYSAALGTQLPVSRIMSFGLGLFYLVVGNYLPKTRKNHTIGIRIPWTLNDREVWDKTHRFGGFVMMAAGALLVGCWLFRVELNDAVMTVLTLLPLALVIGYSGFLYYRKRAIR